MANGEILRKGLRNKKSKYGRSGSDDWDKEDSRKIREARRVKDSVNHAPIIDGQMMAAPFERADAGFNWKVVAPVDADEIERRLNAERNKYRDYITEQNRVMDIIGTDAPAPVIVEAEPEAIVIEVN